MKLLFPAFLCTGVALATWAGYASSHRRPIGGWEPVTHLPFDSASIDRDIATNERAVKIDPYSALGWSFLSSSYMARSRESDDLASAVKAEQAAKKSLSLRKLGNVGAWNKLIGALLQQHRFKDALAECEKAEKERINSDDTTLLHIECMEELGRYNEAAILISKSPRAVKNASGWTVIARLDDIEGKPDQALRVLRDSAVEADKSSGMASNAVSWFHSRLAMQLAKMGRHEEAEKEYKVALEMYPRDYKSMAGLAKLAAQDGRWQDVIDWGNRSDAVAQMADVRALVGDAYAMLGDATKAEEQYGRVAALVGRPSGMNDGLHEVAPGAGTHGHRLDRQYAIYCADHNRDPEGAYAAAIRDFDARKDIYAFDTLAWVCFQKGDKAEAAKAMDKALATNVKDPMVLYHAGVIYEAVGEKEKGAKYLAKALDIDPRFDGIAAPKAAIALKQSDVKVLQ